MQAGGSGAPASSDPSCAPGSGAPAAGAEAAARRTVVVNRTGLVQLGQDGPATRPNGAGQNQPGAAAAEPCGVTIRRLLRTVASAWRRVDTTTGFAPRPGHIPGGAGIVSVTWERDIINVWSVFVCSLQKGHKGHHHGAATEVREVVGTIQETVTYGKGEKQVPPQDHPSNSLPQE
jgi:hypothetical protein